MGREIHLLITVQLSGADMFVMLLRAAGYRVKKDFETDDLIQRDAINYHDLKGFQEKTIPG